MNLKGAIFDLDGTLLDSMPFWESLGADYLKLKGHTPPENIIEILATMSLSQAARYFKETYSISGSEEEIVKEIIGLIESQYRFKVPLKASVIPFLDRLYRNNVKMCVATATDHDLAKAALDRLGALKYFDFILSCSEAGVGKDNPEFFLKALELLKTPQHETMVFEDALHAIKSAKAAGLMVTAVYDESARRQQEEIKAAADIYLNSLADGMMIL
ncbi:MAG TPA: HAD family phosphatase [Syntrophomonadaceae bacterium]|nr:HAD family phosphatase [Syntrophomonadaceae bacterium]HQE24332.1 HAD family phosphatase [Syntrophomonadaceae bacterium]